MLLNCNYITGEQEPRSLKMAGFVVLRGDAGGEVMKISFAVEEFSRTLVK